MPKAPSFHSPCSPGIYPREGIRGVGNRAATGAAFGPGAPAVPSSEIRLYNRLCESLPPGWYAWHSLKLCGDGQDFAEADFVIAVPDLGILIIEVKGGAIRKDGGAWFQNERPMPRSPLDQAQRFKNVLLRRFQALALPCPNIGLAVCFTDTPVDAALTQDDLAGRVFGSESLPYLDSVLPSLAGREIPSLRKPRKGWISGIHTLWCESWIPDRKLSLRKREDEESRLRLDVEQLRLLDRFALNDRVLVQGGPGTGKTVIAMEMARREASSGRRVLVLCYTEALGLEFARALDHPGIMAASIGAFAVRLLRETGHEIVEEYTPEFWNPITLEAALDALPPGDRRWDTVIVDEAQDMGENDWLFIDACAGDAPRLWIFLDPSQTFLPDRRIPASREKDAFKVMLDCPYRCPPPIQALVDLISGGEADKALIKEGVQTGVIKIIGGSASDVDRLIGKEITALLDDGFSRSDIAILSLRGLAFPDNIVNRILIGGEFYCRSSDDRAPDEIVGDTFLRFKGLERPAVIITDVRYVTDRLEERLLIAATRATSVLRIIDERETLKRIQMFSDLMG